MTVVIDHPLYGTLGREFVVRFIEAMARQLASSNLVNFDINNIGEEQMELLFSITFFGVGETEEQSGFEAGGQRYLPQLAFKTTPGDGVVLGDTVLHGLIADEHLEEGLARARG
ncbi:MAG: hypothetical protein AAF318_12465 [Pseudomonadota bacterium]